MRTRNPTYRDLISQGIPEKAVNFLINTLTILHNDDTVSPVTLDTSINQGFYCAGAYYYNALCYAADSNYVDIVEALLKLGAHPNLATHEIAKGSALLLVMKDKPEILTLFLKIPDLDMYVMNNIGCSVFSYTNGNPSMILRLLNADINLDVLSKDEKYDMAIAIADQIRTHESFQNTRAQSLKVYLLVCQYLVKAERKLRKAVTDMLEENTAPQNGASPSRNFQPAVDVVLSYLFKPKSAYLEFAEQTANKMSTGQKTIADTTVSQPPSNERRRTCATM